MLAACVCVSARCAWRVVSLCAVRFVTRDGARGRERCVCVHERLREYHKYAVRLRIIVAGGASVRAARSQRRTTHACALGMSRYDAHRCYHGATVAPPSPGSLPLALPQSSPSLVSHSDAARGADSTTEAGGAVHSPESEQAMEQAHLSLRPPAAPRRFTPSACSPQPL